MTARPLFTKSIQRGAISQFARRHVSTTAPKLLAAANESGDVLFTGEMTNIYQAIFEQHAKPTGPWETMDAQLSKYVSPNSTVLDLATGPGEPGSTMAKRHADTLFILSDISEDMLSKAKTRAEGLSNVSFALVDMQDLKEIDTESMDGVVCCYGLMFPPNTEQAISEIHRVLKPGGTFITTYWKELPLVSFTNGIMEKILGDTPPPPPINPLSLKEEGHVNKLLENAKLTVVEEEEHEYEFDLSADANFAYLAGVLPILPFLEERGDSDREVARQMFDEEVKAQNYLQSNGEIVVPGNVYKLVLAKKQE